MTGLTSPVPAADQPTSVLLTMGPVCELYNQDRETQIMLAAHGQPLQMLLASRSFQDSLCRACLVAPLETRLTSSPKEAHRGLTHRHKGLERAVEEKIPHHLATGEVWHKPY